MSEAAKATTIGTPETFAAKAFGAASPTSPLAATTIRRREPQPHDVQIEILYCGVCHSDLHQTRNEWVATMPTVYPCVPGHEIVGRVARAGKAVTKFKEGDLVAVGCMVDSDRVCENCKAGEEQHCLGETVFTYNSKDPKYGGITYGGYSQSIVVDEAFVLRVPDTLNPAAAAPLLCAGITTYSPMRHWNVKAGQKVGVVGLGGLGHMGLKFAHAFGAKVVLFTTSANKTADALRLGADEVVISKDQAQMRKHNGSMDFIVDTVSGEHDLDAYISLLKLDGKMVMVGAPPKPSPITTIGLLFRRRTLAGSIIGGIRQTQEMLDFCGEHNLGSDIEMIRIDQINDAYERLLRSDVKYRFVIDMASLK
jgi:uncharacterized zinc-type alcohol dehydrogenase-like protein